MPASATPAGSGDTGRFDRPQHTWAPVPTTLRDGSTAEVGLDPAPIEAALSQIAEWTEPRGATRPLFAGAVTLMGHRGVIVSRTATGHVLRYADGSGTELPPEQQIPATENTIFDLASVSKLFTSIVVLQQVEAGRVNLDTPVADYLPEFAAEGKAAVTVRQLLTHTSGLPAWLPLWRDWPDRESRLLAAMQARPVAAPGTRYLYSDLNMITLGVLAERVSGRPLDVLVAEGITEPLGMADTGYNPAPELRSRIAATEYQVNPPRGLVHGEVHDENAWSLGGVAGHAGVFSTADDLARLAQALLNGGTYGGNRILQASTVEEMLTDANVDFPGNAHGLGFELAQRWYMDGLSAPRTAGHTGYTGTSLVIDPASQSFVILLTNRVHPSRSWGTNNPARRAVAQGLAQALRVVPRHGPTAWFGGVGDRRDARLTLPLDLPGPDTSMTFDAFVDTESTDLLRLEASTDGGGSWAPVPFTVQDRSETWSTTGAVAGSGHRRWWRVSANLADYVGAVQLRWRYTTDGLYQGRGVYIDGVRVVDPDRVIFDGERAPEAFIADGWVSATG